MVVILRRAQRLRVIVFFVEPSLLALFSLVLFFGSFGLDVCCLPQQWTRCIGRLLY